jgi:thiamine pyrophosphokinase
MKALVFANGEAYPGVMVQRTFAQAPDAYIIAADGGAHVAEFFGYRVQTLIGDLDSLAPEDVQQYEQQGAQIQRYPPVKDETDLELALRWAAQQGVTWLRIIGGMGGRIDQMLANIYLLALPELQTLDVALVANHQALYLLSAGKHHVHGQPDDTLSLLPLSSTVTGIETRHLQYPLRHETLYVGPARGISNVMLAHTAEITFTAGLLLVVHTVGKA